MAIYYLQLYRINLQGEVVDNTPRGCGCIGGDPNDHFAFVARMESAAAPFIPTDCAGYKLEAMGDDSDIVKSFDRYH